MKKALICAVMVVAASLSSWSQTERINSKNTFTGLNEDQDAEYGEDSGTIVASEVTASKAPSKPKYFSISFVNLVEYDSNALLRNVNAVDDLLIMPSLDFSYYRPLGAGFSFIAGANINSTFFANVDDSDYWGASARIGADYRYNSKWPRLYATFNPYYYQSFDTGDRITESLAFTLGGDQQWLFNQNNTVLSVGANYSYYATAPSIDDRDAFSAVLGVTQTLFKDAYLQPFYLFQYTNYHNQPREDFRHVVGLAFIYDFNSWLSARIYGNYTKNDSSLNTADYDNFASGLGTGVSVRF